jgi:drug/metabolite transporter (DMT)-like permease
MALLAKLKGRSLRLDRQGMQAALFIGIAQFCINFNSVYLAERHITSGVVATIFALLLIPNSLLGWLFLGQRPGRRFAIGSVVAVAGIVLLCVHELRANPAPTSDVLTGIGVTLLGLSSASSANVYQAREHVRRHHLASLLAWSMAIGALIDIALAWAVSGPPVLTARTGYWAGVLYLSLFASALGFSLYFPVVRKIGPGKAAYSSVLVPVIAMAFSTVIEGYRWNWIAAAGAVLTLAGMLIAMSRGRLVVQSPDAA